jgi:hypothetical protein
MIDTFGTTVINPSQKSTARQTVYNDWVWRFWFFALVGVSLAIGLYMYRSGPSISIIAGIIYLLGVGIILLNPRYGLYLVLFLTLVGDFRLLPWYPFTKNFSSPESLLFIHDAIIVSPLETYLILIFVSWAGRRIIQRKLLFHKGILFWPTVTFTVFITFGLIWGLLKGGNFNIALWESRAIFYMPLVLLLTTNLLKTSRHINAIIWFATIALFLESLFGNYHYFFNLNRNLSSVDRIAGHSAAIHLNTYFIFLLSVWVFRASHIKRLTLPIMLPFFLITFIVMQRRAGFITLALAIVLLIIILFQENRRLFYAITPILVIGLAVYLGIYWNRSGALGLPAQAVKSIFFTDQANAKDQASNYYRILENTNIRFTIHQSPLTGIGFGNKFYRIVKMPDISHFVFHEYITHNSIVWIWMKSGFGGFFSMIFLVGLSIITGLRSLHRQFDPNMKAIMLTATLYIVMHFVYGYVDMSWDIESMVYIGVMMGLINIHEYITETNSG